MAELLDDEVFTCCVCGGIFGIAEGSFPAGSFGQYWCQIPPGCHEFQVGPEGFTCYGCCPDGPYIYDNED